MFEKFATLEYVIELLTSLLMAYICNRYDTLSDWLILENYYLVITMGRLRAGKNKPKSRIIKNLLTSIGPGRKISV